MNSSLSYSLMFVLSGSNDNFLTSGTIENLAEIYRALVHQTNPSGFCVLKGGKPKKE